MNLIGDHTDYNNGLVLPFAIAQGTRVTAERTGDKRVSVTSSTPSEPVETSVDVEPSSRSNTWADYVLGCFWAVRQAGIELDGVRISVDGDVPRGAGLASSASLTCATTLALLDVFDAQFSLLEVAQLARAAETDFVGAPVGLMDQVVSVFATPGHATLLDVARLSTEQVRFEPEREGRCLLVVDSGVRHQVPAGVYAERVAACQEAAAELGVESLSLIADPVDVDRLSDPVLRARARHVVSENARVREVAEHLRAGQPDQIGPALLASHASLRDDFEVSTPELDLLVTAATAAGADGARLTGAGFGGCVIVLAPVQRRRAVEQSLRRASAERGGPEPRIWSAQAGPGAHRLPPGHDEDAGQRTDEELSIPLSPDRRMGEGFEYPPHGGLP